MTEDLDAIFQQDWLILGTLSMDKGKYGNLGCTFGWFGALRGAPSTTDGLLRCGVTDRVGGDQKKVSDFILLQNGLTLATLSMDKGKCYLGGISGWSGALRGAPSASDG